MTVIDCSSNLPPAWALQQAGVEGAVRYLSTPGVGDWKRIFQPEYDAASVPLALVFEDYANDWVRCDGNADGATAVAQAQALGYEPGKMIYTAGADYDIGWSDYSGRGRDYLNAFSDHVQGAGYRWGVYGPWDALEWVRSDYGTHVGLWQCMSTAFSGWRNATQYPHANLRQTHSTFIGGVEVDLNNVLTPDWGQLSSAEDDDMTPEESQRLANVERLTANTERCVTYLIRGIDTVDGLIFRVPGPPEPPMDNTPLVLLREIADRVESLEATELTDAQVAAIAAQVVPAVSSSIAQLATVVESVSQQVASLVRGLGSVDNT